MNGGWTYKFIDNFVLLIEQTLLGINMVFIVVTVYIMHLGLGGRTNLVSLNMLKM